MSAGLELELVTADSPRVEAIWSALETTAAPSYFLSWGWMENWLACLPREHRPQLAALLRRGEPVAAAFVSSRATVRHHVWPCRSVFVNTIGIPRYDEVTLEHNGLLRRPDGGTLDELLELLPPVWDEIVIPALDAEQLPAPTRSIEITREVASPYVDLARVRGAAGGYVALLGPTTRAQIRRARRAAGDVLYKRATSLDDALDIYRELVALHAATWQARGETGVFADPWIDHFHRRLIETRFASGEIELARVVHPSGTIGCLYNFRYRGVVAFYQSGLAYDDDPHAKPGYVCHAAAIEHAASAGDRVYDFLGGDARYKRDLATDRTTLVWARIRRPLWRFAVEDWLRAWRASRARARGRHARQAVRPSRETTSRMGDPFRIGRRR